MRAARLVGSDYGRSSVDRLGGSDLGGGLATHRALAKNGRGTGRSAVTLYLMGSYSDLMGFYSDLMGFYSDLMGFIVTDSDNIVIIYDFNGFFKDLVGGLKPLIYSDF